MNNAGLHRIFFKDGTTYDLNITMPWGAFVNQLIMMNCVITFDGFFDRAGIVRIMKIYSLTDEMPASGEVIPFPDPKGSA